MLVLRLLLMVLSIICLMDGHAEVSSSTTEIRNGEGNPAARPNQSEIKILDRKKKKGGKKGKKGKKPKPKPNKPKPKPKPKPTKPVTTTPLTTPLKTTSTSNTHTTITTTVTTTAKPTTTSTTTTTQTTTHETTTTSATTTTRTTTKTTTSPPTTPDYGDCEATNGSPCIFPFKDGSTEYNECANEKGRYYWCATSVYSSGKYKSWQYCPLDGSCPLPGGDCKATNKMPCYFPFQHDGEEYNECIDDGKKLWCATSTTSSGNWNNWGYCPDDGTCPLPPKSTTTASTTTVSLPNNDTAASTIANVENALTDINETLQNLETAGFSEDEKQLLKTMNDISDHLETSSRIRSFYDAVKITSWTQLLYSTTAKIKATKQVNPGYNSAFQTTKETCSIKLKNAKLSKANAGPGRMFDLDTISEILAIIPDVPSSSSCCAKCKAEAADTEIFEHSINQKQCDCYKTVSGVPPVTMASSVLDSGVCLDEGSCSSTRCGTCGQTPCTIDCKTQTGGTCKIPFTYGEFTYNKCVYDYIKQYHWCYHTAMSSMSTQSLWGICTGDLKCHENGECSKKWLETHQGVRTYGSNIDTKIIGGNTLVGGFWEYWPWIASVFLKDFIVENGIKKPGKCTGVLISCQHIATARHCIYWEGVYADRVEIGLGSTTHAGKLDENSRRRVQAYYWTNTDLAILKLEKRIDPLLEPEIRPILLPDEELKILPNSENENERSEHYFVAGWGKIDKDGKIEPFGLKETNRLKIRKPKFCKDRDNSFDIQKHICIQVFDNDSTHKGDSGGPGMIEKNNKWYLQTITSGNIADTVPGSGGGERMMNIFYYKDDIKNIINGKKPNSWNLKKI